MEEYTMRRAATGILFLALAVLVPSSLASQVVQGSVRSTEGEVIAGAKVLLLDEAFATISEVVTDDEGRYRLRAPGPGEYTLMVDREGFANQTSSASLPANGTLEHDIVIIVQRVGETDLMPADTIGDAELLAAAIADACRDVFVPALHSILFGSIRDQKTEMAIPGAVAVIIWEDRFLTALGDRRKEGKGDSRGGYLICDAPAGEPLRVRGEALQTEGPEVSVQLTAGTMRRLDLVVDVNDPATPGDILGRVIDQYTGKTIPNARIQLNDTDHEAVSNDRGMFYLAGVRWGLYAMTVEHATYGKQEQVVRIIGGRAHDIEVRLTPDAIEIAPLLVRIRPRRWFREMEGLEYRISRGFGIIRLRAEIEAMGALNLGEVLRGMPGVRITQSGSLITGTYVVQMRGARDMMNRPCPPMLWVDGMKWGKEQHFYNQILGIELEAVEAYRGPAEVPGEFLDGDASCGVVVAWTRRGMIR